MLDEERIKLYNMNVNARVSRSSNGGVDRIIQQQPVFHLLPPSNLLTVTTYDTSE